MTARAAVLVLAALTLGSSACRKAPDPYMPSEWREPTTIEQPSRLQSWLKMSDRKAPMQFVKDVHPYVEGGVWRWTGQQPTVVVAAPKPKGLKFAADIAVPEIAMTHTGPVTITVTFNGRELTRERYDTPGTKRIDKPVPDEWLRATGENIVEMDIDKMWTAPDAKQYGFVLTALGLLDTHGALPRN